MGKNYGLAFDGQTYLPVSAKYALVRDDKGVKVVTRGSYKAARRKANKIARRQRHINRRRA